MKINILKPRLALNKAFLKIKPNRKDIELFKTNLITLLEQINETESEEHHKNIVSKFLDSTYYNGKHYINTKGRNDLVIHNGKDAKTSVGVIIEAKKPTNKAEMIKSFAVGDSHQQMILKLNTKAFQELVLYYLRERITHRNLTINYLVATNIYEWFIFDANTFEKAFANNKTLVKQFIDFEEGRLAGKTTDFFYKEIAEPAIATLTSEISFAHFDFRDYEQTVKNTDKSDDNKLIALYKLLSPEHLLKLPFLNDSNSLDKTFYSELLHIIGLTETKEGGKKLIERKKEGQRNNASLLENAIIQLDSLDKINRLENPTQFGNNQQEKLFNVGLELTITWINRILFLKLLEAQLISYNNGDKSYAILHTEKLKDYDDVNSLFFQVLAKLHAERSESINAIFGKIPYLNSSLFEPTELEHSCLFINQLENDKKLPILSSTVLKDKTGKKRTGELNAIEYIFDFLDAYDFASEGSEDIQEDNKTLINASVLGLIFEKINGYKDGSFFTPGFITMYMCRETIRRAVLQKFKETKNWDCADLDALYNKIDNTTEANTIINSIKICDPAVGSGHFLVSALNEIITVKNDLKILQDKDGKRLKEYHVEVVNDELVISDEDGKPFKYNPTSKESQRVQETLFHEKQTIIENCLFGVDINPNSVKICRLRLWIELLKNAYYKQTGVLETLPNIDINIKCGNSLISRFPLDADLKDALKKSKSKWTIDTYKIAVQTYREAKSKEEKRDMERLIADIKNDFRSFISINDPKIKTVNKKRGELFNLTQTPELFEANAKKTKDWKKKVDDISKEIEKLETEIADIKNNKIYENAFEWRFEFPEALNNDGDFIGFDVCIGNPPWGAELEPVSLNLIKSTNDDIIVRMVDTFMFFINLCFKLKHENGIVSQIVPDVLLYQVDNEKLRNKILSKYQLHLAVNLGDNIFEDVARASCIVIIGSLQNNITEVFEYQTAIDIKITKKISLETNFFDSLPHKIFATKNISGYSLLSRFKDSKIIDLVDKDGIQRGISPDLKEAFIVNDEIILKYNLENEFLFPTITGGRDTKRYYSKIIGKSVIYTKKGDDESKISNIVKYISEFKELITCNEVKQNKHPFWALHRARNQEIFEKDEKIIGVITGDKIFTSIDDSYLYPTDGLYLFCSNNIYTNTFLVGLLNSKLITYLYRLISMEVNRTLAQIKPSILEELPVSKSFNKNIVSQIETLTLEIIKMVKIDNLDFLNQSKEIDQLVYQLYDLTAEEISIIENN